MDEEGGTQVLLEEMRSQFAAVLDIVVPLSQDVLEIKEILVIHGSRLDKLEGQMSGVIATLADHSAILNEHTAILNEHTATLAEHTAILAEHSAILREHSDDLKEIKIHVAVHAEAITELRTG